MTLDVLRSLVPSAPTHVFAHRLAKVLESATADEMRELDSILPLWVANAPARDGTLNPQQTALDSEADELFYGGQAGGGKTHLVIGAAATRHRKSLILRRELTQATDMIDEARAVAGRFGAFNGTRHRLLIRRPGEPMRDITFSGLPNAGDEVRFKGRAHDLKAFDEVTEFLHSQYTFIIAWNRTTVPGQRCRVIATGNPPTHADGFWVISHWAPWLDEMHPDFPAQVGQLRWYATIDGKDTEVEGPAMIRHRGEFLYPKSRTFIPATLSDNPILESTGYRARLQNLPEPLRSQLLHGDFRIGLEDDAFQLIPTDWLRLAVQRSKEVARPDIRQTHVGVDVARGGKDQTVVCPRAAWWVDPLHAYAGTTTRDGASVAAVVLPHAARGGIVTIDAEGIGASPYDILAQNERLRVVPVRFSEGAPKESTDRSGVLSFANLRAFCYWSLREALDPDKSVNPFPMALPDDRELFGDLASIRYGTRSGRVLVEDKDEIRKRLGRSPDKGDALAVTFVIEGLVTLPTTSVRGGYSDLSDINPWEWGS